MTPLPGGGAVAGLVLAAGAGRRFGQPKAGVVVDGQRLVDRAVRLLADGGCHPVVVVSGALALDVPGATVTENPGWAQGLGSSLRAGLAALPPRANAVVVALVDTPWLGAAAVTRLVQAHRQGARIAVATYAGRRGHPVLLDRSTWSAASELAVGDTGARALLAARPELVVEVACDGTGRPDDVDVPDDLEAGPAAGR